MTDQLLGPDPARKDRFNQLAIFLYGGEIAILTVLSLVPIPSIPSAIPLVTSKGIPSDWTLLINFWDKGQHLIEYALLYLTGSLIYTENKSQLAGHLLLYGMLIEGLQELLTTTRHAQLGDLVADVVGILLGKLVWTTLCLTRSRLAFKRSTLVAP